MALELSSKLKQAKLYHHWYNNIDNIILYQIWLRLYMKVFEVESVFNSKFHNKFKLETGYQKLTKHENCA